MSLKIKKSYAEVVIGFNNSSIPLGKRKDLHKLYEFAKQTNNKRYLDMFEDVPSDKELDDIKSSAFKEKQDSKKSNQ